jgi:hypothetical protein
LRKFDNWLVVNTVRHESDGLNPDAIRQALFRLLCYAAVFFVIVSHYRTKDQVYSLVKTILFMGCFLVVFAILSK